MNYKPKPLTKSEWSEIVKIREVREGYGIEDKTDEEAFAAGSYAAKFEYMSDGPGYAGELYVILGGVPECPPLVIIRSEGNLIAVDSRGY